MENKNKILIATGIYPPDFRGPATLLEALPDALRVAGFEIKILTYSDVGGSSDEQRQDNVWRVSRKQSAMLRFIKYFWLMRKLGKWSDVMYVTDTYSVGYFAYLLKKICGIKYIIRFAGDSAWETAAARGWTSDYIVDFQNKTYDARIEKLKNRRKKILVNADKIIAVSNFMASIAGQIGVAEEKIAVIYNSVDFIRDSEIDLAAVERIRSQYKNNARLIVTACQLVPWKGVAGLIKILPKLNEKIGQVNLLVLGEGQEMDNLKTLTMNLGLSQNVYFPGKIKRNEILNYYKAADLFVLNSNYEGLSHVLLEVMKAGTPIVSTGSGGNPEVIEGGREGLLVDFNNEEELSDAALKILNDKNLAESLVAGAREKLNKFSWSDSIQKTTMVLKSLSEDVV